MKYTYRGPDHATTISTGDKVHFEGCLSDGMDVELPEDHPLVLVWVARDWLKPPAPPAPPAAEPETPLAGDGRKRSGGLVPLATSEATN